MREKSATGTASRATTRPGRHPVQKAAAAVGIVFLLVGILGFIPGVTTHYDQMEFTGHMSGAMLLGLFNVSVPHNLVHLAFGVAGLALARRAPSARTYLIVGGIIYAVLWIYGLVVTHNTPANFVPVNNADNWLHLLLAARCRRPGATHNQPRRRNSRKSSAAMTAVRVMLATNPDHSWKPG